MMLIWKGAERQYWGGESGRQCMKWWVGSLVGRVLQLCSRVKARERGCRVTSQGFPCAVLMGDWFRGGGSEEVLPPIQCRISVIAGHIQLSAEVWRREFRLDASLSFFLHPFFPSIPCLHTDLHLCSHFPNSTPCWSSSSPSSCLLISVADMPWAPCVY